MEVRDARVPLCSTCARLEDLIQQKRRIIVMNKSDLIEPADTARWARHFTQQGQAVAFTNASKGSRVGDLMPQQLLKRGLLPRADRMLLFMIIGVPNTGKSTMINALRRNGMRARRQADGVSNVAETGARPGVTRHVSTVQFCSEPPVPSRVPRTGHRQACRHHNPALRQAPAQRHLRTHNSLSLVWVAVLPEGLRVPSHRHAHPQTYKIDLEILNDKDVLA